MMHAMNHADHGAAFPGETPIEILRRRYALGQIDAAQFEEMKRVLGSSETLGHEAEGHRGHRHGAHG
jgi:hypothetical protein